MNLKKTIAAGALGLALIVSSFTACKKAPVNFAQPTISLEEQVKCDAVAKEAAAIPDYWAESDFVGYGRFEKAKGVDYFFTGFWKYKKNGEPLKFLEAKLGEYVDVRAENPLGVNFKPNSNYIIFAKDGKAVKILPYDSEYVGKMNELRVAEAVHK